MNRSDLAGVTCHAVFETGEATKKRTKCGMQVGAQVGEPSAGYCAKRVDGISRRTTAAATAERYIDGTDDHKTETLLTRNEMLIVVKRTLFTT